MIFLTKNEMQIVLSTRKSAKESRCEGPFSAPEDKNLKNGMCASRYSILIKSSW